ncbi:MAG TPA: hypothetical protein VMD52_02100 [Patescibacteria group bacterium]|nr:hypothetical protein [Patescibacteria group bacterium]
MTPRRKDLAAIALLVVFVALFYAPLFQGLTTTVPTTDWYAIYAFPSFFRLSVLEYHQFPLRAPHFGGGYPLIGHPYDISLTPFSIPVLLFGAIAGTKITVFLIFLIGTLSVFYLTRYLLRYPVLGALFSSLVFAFSSWGGCMYLDACCEKLYAYFLPTALIFFIRSVENRKFIFLTCLTLSILVLRSGETLLPVLLFLFLFACLYTIRMEKGAGVRFDGRYLKVFLLTVGITFLLCMVKILPMHNLLSRADVGPIHFSFEHDYAAVSKFIIEQGRSLDPHRLYDMLFSKDKYLIGIDWGTGDDHMQFHLGYLPVLFAGIAFILYWRKTLRYLFLLVVFVLLSFGPNAKPDLFRWFWHVHPIVHGMWKPDEFFTFPIFFILSVAAGGCFFLTGTKRGKVFMWLLIPAAVLSLHAMFLPNRRFLHNQTLKEFPKKMVQPISDEEMHGLAFQRQFYQVKMKDRRDDTEYYQKDGYYYLQQNIGMADWVYINVGIHSAVIPKYFVERGDYVHPPRAAHKLTPNPHYRGEAFFLEKYNNARIEYFSPNQIRIAVSLQGAGTLMVNQNYHEAWRTDTGRLSEREGLLAIALNEPGSYAVQLTYVPLDFYFGLGISVITLACCLYFLIFRAHPSSRPALPASLP